MNVYDFDNTIYDGDSTIDYYLFCLKRHPVLLLKMPKQMIKFFQYRLKKIKKEEFKESIYQGLVQCSDFPENIIEFWNTHEKNIKKFYLEQKKEDDLIISASPEFLIEEIGKRLNFHVIASSVNRETGKHDDGVNCHGKRKVERFLKEYPTAKIDLFYSDSLSDTPLAKISKKAYLVLGEAVVPWGEQNDDLLSKIKKKIFDR